MHLAEILVLAVMLSAEHNDRRRQLYCGIIMTGIFRPEKGKFQAKYEAGIHYSFSFPSPFSGGMGIPLLLTSHRHPVSVLCPRAPFCVPTLACPLSRICTFGQVLLSNSTYCPMSPSFRDG